MSKELIRRGIYIPTWLWNRAEKHAKKNGFRSMSAWVRHLIIEAIKD